MFAWVTSGVSGFLPPPKNITVDRLAMLNVCMHGDLQWPNIPSSEDSRHTTSVLGIDEVQEQVQ